MGRTRCLRPVTLAEETSETESFADSRLGRGPHMEVHLYAWIITVVVMVTILAIDVLILGRRPHEPSMKEAGLFIGIFVALAVIFGFGVWAVSGPQYAGEFFAGWITEYSLSIDNLFIFLVIMTKLKVPRQLQQFALLVGIILALIFRGVFIALGAAVINAFSWVFFIFGAFLVWTAVKLYLDYRKHDEDTEAPPDNPALRFVKRRFNATEDYRGTSLTVVEDGKRLITPMFVVIVALGSTDLLFALDSIPAIYGLTQEPYLVFTANVFALMGLRQLYFLIGGLLKKLVYLSLGSLGSADVDLMRRLVEELAGSPHRFVVSKGPQHELFELADNMTGAEFLPQASILPEVDLVVTHGGNNTVTESFFFGKPMVVLPLFWDQYDNAQRVHELGYGVRLDTYGHEPDDLREAIDLLLADEMLRQRLSRISARLQADPGTTRAAGLIERVAETSERLA